MDFINDHKGKVSCCELMTPVMSSEVVTESVQSCDLRNITSDFFSCVNFKNDEYSADETPESVKPDTRTDCTIGKRMVKQNNFVYD